MDQENNNNSKQDNNSMEAPLEEGKKSVEQERGKGTTARHRKVQRKPQAQTSMTDPDLEERVVAVTRVAKVVKGGRRFSFSALIVVGDKKGHVGYGLGKAKEVPEAIRKATQAARKHMIRVTSDKGTIPHVTLGEFCGAKVLFRPAAEGTGVKAAGACRSILELSGIKNVLTKSLRGNNPHNIVKATFAALKSLRSAEQVAQIRGIDVKNVRLK